VRRLFQWNGRNFDLLTSWLRKVSAGKRSLQYRNLLASGSVLFAS
jgi:hypothetical protein